jgi:hypothetical protein
MEMLFGNFSTEVGREDISNQRVGNRTYVKLVMVPYPKI